MGKGSREITFWATFVLCVWIVLTVHRIRCLSYITGKQIFVSMIIDLESF